MTTLEESLRWSAQLAQVDTWIEAKSETYVVVEISEGSTTSAKVGDLIHEFRTSGFEGMLIDLRVPRFPNNEGEYRLELHITIGDKS